MVVSRPTKKINKDDKKLNSKQIFNRNILAVVQEMKMNINEIRDLSLLDFYMILAWLNDIARIKERDFLEIKTKNKK